MNEFSPATFFKKFSVVLPLMLCTCFRVTCQPGYTDVINPIWNLHSSHAKQTHKEAVNTSMFVGVPLSEVVTRDGQEMSPTLVLVGFQYECR